MTVCRGHPNTRNVEFVTFRTFVRTNARWLIGAGTLTFFSGPGQTYFIALFGADLRAVHGLSPGDFGLLYMVATLASAASVVWLGRYADLWSVRRQAITVVLCLAGFAALMASTTSLLLFALAIYGLRLFGQGLASHVAITAMGRWFERERGRAVAVAGVGYQLGEGLVPIAIVTLLGLVDWRWLWWLVVLLLIGVALPVVMRGFAVDRVPRRDAATDDCRTGRHWTRREALRDPMFWLVCSGVLTPAFVGTSILFHQSSIGTAKGWPPTVIAAGFVPMAGATVCAALLTGVAIDRIGAHRLLPSFLLPLAAAAFTLGVGAEPWSGYVGLSLIGLAYGLHSAIFGAVWAELYGTRHLGAIRATVFAGMVFSSALGPGLTGWLIDQGIGIERQLVALALWSLLAAIAMVLAARTLGRRLADVATAFTVPPLRTTGTP